MRYIISKTPPIKPEWGHSWMSWKLWEMRYSFDIFDSTLCNTAELFISQMLHNFFRSIICCFELKHCFWHRGPTVYSSSANPNYSIFRILKKKWYSEYKRPHQFIQRHLTSLTLLTQTCSEWKADEEQLTEAACSAKKYQCEETCCILSTLTQITKCTLDRILQDGKLESVWLTVLKFLLFSYLRPYFVSQAHYYSEC